MTEIQLKYRVAWLYVGLQAFLLVLTAFLSLKGGFLFPQVKDIASRIVPMFAGMTTAMFSFVITDRYRLKDDSSSVTWTFAIMTLLFPTVFTVVVGTLLCLQAYNALIHFESFSQFLDLLTLAEGGFAVYANKFISSLFADVKS